MSKEQYEQRINVPSESKGLLYSYGEPKLSSVTETRTCRCTQNYITSGGIKPENSTYDMTWTEYSWLQDQFEKYFKLSLGLQTTMKCEYICCW